MKFLNDKGFSLAEVMVAAGLIGGISLAVAHLSKLMNQTIKDSEIRFDKLSLNGEINGILGDSVACANTLAGLNAASDKLDEIKDATGNTRFKSNVTYGTQNIVINNFKLDSSSDDVGLLSPGKGTTKLIINYANKKGVHSNKDYSIRIGVETDNNDIITSCGALSSGANSHWQNSPTITDAIYFNGSGVGINTTTPATALDVNGSVKVGDTTVSCTEDNAGSIVYRDDGIKKGFYVCYDLLWRKIATESPFVWVDTTDQNESQLSACTRNGHKTASDQGYGICASGERQPREGDDASKISYKYGTWGGPSTGGTASFSGYCYSSGSKHDNDGTDLLVAWLCERI